jgi:hypothetical protein
MTDTPQTTGIFPAPTLLKRVLSAPSSWTLEAFCLLDEAQPGLLRFATSSRPEWRHCSAAEEVHPLQTQLALSPSASSRRRERMPGAFP